MKNRPLNPKDLIRETIDCWQEDNVFQLGAALSYYAVFSLGPLLLILVAIAGFAFGKDAAQGVLFTNLIRFFGADTAHSLQSLLAATHLKSSNVLATIIGLVTLIIGATGFFTNLRLTLDQIIGKGKKSSGGAMALVQQRAWAFAMILVIGLLLLLFVVADTTLSAFWGKITELVSSPLLLGVIYFVASFFLLTLAFASVFRYVPDKRTSWGSVLVGGALTAVLFDIGKFLIGLYLAKTSIASVYGAAGSVIVVLISVFYNSQILFLGAEFTQVYEGKKIKEEPARSRAVPRLRPEHA